MQLWQTYSIILFGGKKKKKKNSSSTHSNYFHDRPCAAQLSQTRRSSRPTLLSTLPLELTSPASKASSGWCNLVIPTQHYSGTLKHSAHWNVGSNLKKLEPEWVFIDCERGEQQWALYPLMGLCSLFEHRRTPLTCLFPFAIKQTMSACVVGS